MNDMLSKGVKVVSVANENWKDGVQAIWCILKYNLW